jgi:NAD(P)-dependent dehydrogenase (short-subunit alcohol dehydrogenase family)
MTNWTVHDIGDLDGRRVLVTGANRGLGFEVSRVLARAGAHVLLACRDLASGAQAVQRIQAEHPLAQLSLHHLDLARLQSVASCADVLLARDLVPDIIIANAGIYRLPRRMETEDGFEHQFAVNYLGHAALIRLLLPELITRSGHSRIVHVTSLLHRMPGQLQLDDLHWERRRYSPGGAYNASKLANVLFLQELDRRYPGSRFNLRSVGAHPGATATDLHNRGPFLDRFSIWNGLVTSGTLAIAQSTARGVFPILYAATSSDAIGGAVYGPDGMLELRGKSVRQARISAQATPDLARELWSTTTELLYRAGI